jgi:hypothetical protein
LSFHFPISLLKKQFWKINCPRLPLIWCEIHPQFPWVSKAGDSSARLHQKVEIHQQIIDREGLWRQSLGTGNCQNCNLISSSGGTSTRAENQSTAKNEFSGRWI